MEDEAGSGVLSEASGTDYATGKFLLFHFIPIMLCVGGGLFKNRWEKLILYFLLN